MSNTVGGANVEITANDNQARSTVKGFFGFLKQTGKIASGVAAGMAFFEGIKNTINHLSQSTIGANASMEQYVNTLSVVLKSNEKAVETLAWAEKFAASTPFEIPDIVEATVRLESYGLKAKDVLGKTGDMAAVMGKPLMQAVEAVADAQTGELERLKEFGITKDMLIKKSAEMGKKEVVNAKGQITDMAGFNEALFALMEDRFQGGMEIQSKTFNGMISNVKDAAGTIARDLSKPLFEKLKSQLESLVPIMSGVTAFIKGDWVEGSKILTEAFGAEKALKIENFFIRIQLAIHNLKEWILSFKPTIENLKNTFKNLEPVLTFVGGAIAVAWKKVAEILPPLINTLTEIAAKITEWEGFIPVLAGLAAAMTAYRLVVLATIAAQKLQELWTKRQAIAQGALNAVMSLNPIGIVIAALVGLGFALVVAYKKSETFRNIVNSVWEAMKNAWSAVVDFFTVTVPRWVANMVQWFTDMKDKVAAKIDEFKNSGKEKFDSFVVLVKAIIEPWVKWFKNTIENWKLIILGIVSIFVGLFTGDMENLRLGAMAIIEAFKRQFQNTIELLKTAIIDKVVALKNKAVEKFKNLKDEAISKAEELKNSAITKFENLRSGASAKFEQMKSNIKTAFTDAKDWAIKKVTDLYNGFVEWVTKVPEEAQEMKDELIGKFKSINLKQVGKDIVQGLINGLTSKAGELWGKAKDIADGIKGRIQGALDIHSPSRVMIWMGEMLGSGLVKGMDDSISSIQKTTQRLADAAVPNFKSTDFPAMKNGSFYFDGLKESSRKIEQVINIHSPTPLSPSEIAKKNLQVSRQLAMLW